MTVPTKLNAFFSKSGLLITLEFGGMFEQDVTINNIIGRKYF